MFHVLPVPYDATSTWHKGADRGPWAILEASAHVEWFDIQTRSEPHVLGVHTHAPITTDGPPDQLARIVESHVTPLMTVSKDPGRAGRGALGVDRGYPRGGRDCIRS